MHEMGIMAAILEQASEAARQQGATRIRRIELAIGEHAGVVSEALSFAFEAMGPGSMAAGAELVIDLIPLSYRCPSCQGASTQGLQKCPDCGLFYELATGRELNLIAIEVE